MGGARVERWSHLPTSPPAVYRCSAGVGRGAVMRAGSERSQLSAPLLHLQHYSNPTVSVEERQCRGAVRDDLISARSPLYSGPTVSMEQRWCGRAVRNVISLLAPPPPLVRQCSLRAQLQTGHGPEMGGGPGVDDPWAGEHHLTSHEIVTGRIMPTPWLLKRQNTDAETQCSILGDEMSVYLKELTRGGCG